MEENKLTWEEFTKVEMRIGTIESAEIFKEVKNPAYKMIIDFGPLGKRKTSAQITALYQPEDLIGKQIVAVVNFPPKQIANIMSECLVLGALGENKDVTLIEPGLKLKNGARIA
ncbi:tRNA-binding protein [Lishizhenia tianjinensis]|uniref:tRNA-binding protein n=1 Tax=Lishizhenia tianjinensis TaxID=477690 RepID=A0A1I6XLK7_9FLAO|nr:tRNA-binding protein [Lishizhenia tianjinensis]SFT39268.1 tRNA-binding protein [Lishizhenia tianjinensis]